MATLIDMDDQKTGDGAGEKASPVARAFRFAVLALALVLGVVGVLAYLGGDKTLPFDYEGID